MTHPIEIESYRILRERIDLSHLPPLSRAVTERVIHASADLEYARSLVLDEAALEAGRAALRAGEPLIVDARMVATGITSREAICLLGPGASPAGEPHRLPGADHPSEPDPAGAKSGHAAPLHTTRSAATVRAIAPTIGSGAVWAIGNAPTALSELLALAAAGALAPPALVIGLPVGFVGAADAKAALAASDLPHLTNRGEKGGSAVAAAAVNALIYEETMP